MKAPAHSIHEYGVIPKFMLPEKDLTWDEYHNEDDITNEMDSLGLGFLDRFPVMYDQVYLDALQDLLEEDVVNLAGYAWPTPKDGEYPRTEGNFNHAFMGFDLPLTEIFDNYVDAVDGDWIKNLASDYKFYNYGYRIYIPEERAKLDTRTWLIRIIKRIFGFLLKG